MTKGHKSTSKGNHHNSQEQVCHESILASTPVAMTSNRLLWGDWNLGEYGVLLRSHDVFDRSEKEMKKDWLEIMPFELDPNYIPHLTHLPVSYIHASMRTRDALYQHKSYTAFSLLLGTKFAKNWAMKDFQTDEKSIDCSTLFPFDAGTFSRGTLIDGAHCYENRTAALCVDNDCLAGRDSACGGCKVAPQDYGDLIARYSERSQRKEGGLTYFSCEYSTVEDIVSASNSIWKERFRWFSLDQNEYSGYTECPVPKNKVREKSLMDALVIPIVVGEEGRQSLCAFGEGVNHIEERLKLATNLGYGDLPVLFYRETKGMDQADCDRVWGGQDCQDGWKKEFYVQEFSFPNGACLHRPPECKEVYYFPPSTDGMCSAFTANGKLRINELCPKESSMDAHVAAINAQAATRVAATKEASLMVVSNLRADITRSFPEPDQYDLTAQPPLPHAFVSQTSLIVLGLLLSLLMRRKMSIVTLPQMRQFRCTNKSEIPNEYSCTGKSKCSY